MKYLFLPILLLFVHAACAQSSDFLVLKKNKKTIRSYFASSYIVFRTQNGGEFNVQIERISKDSLHVIEYLIVQVPTRLGVYVLDTAARYRYRFHVNEIKSIHLDKRGFNFARSGSTLMGGALLLTVATGISYIVDRKRANVNLMLAGLGLGVAGYFISRLQTTNYVIGRKYQLKYVSTQTR
jgi:hypothetical protein